MCYFSRKGFDHAYGRAFNAMDNVVKRQLLHDEVVLDGELLVWNKKRCVPRNHTGSQCLVIIPRYMRDTWMQLMWRASEVGLWGGAETVGV